jgi:anti-sigma factor RsiW
MPDCASIDPLVTPYVDGELPSADRARFEAHLEVCPPCSSRVAAERSVQRLLSSRRDSLLLERAPDVLRVRCADASRDGRRADVGNAALTPWLAVRRLAPLAVAASLVLIVGAAFFYQFTARSSRLMAAELAADHVKCFTLNGLLGTHQTPSAVESAMASSFGWPLHLPETAEQAGLELIGSRPCLYGEGRTAHLMFRHNGQPVSLFMLPARRRAQEVIDVFGHEAAVWSVGDRTFVMISGERRAEVERLASFMRSSIQ